MIKNIIIICILLFLIYKVFFESNEKFNNHGVYNDSVKIKRNKFVYGDEQFITKNLDYDEDTIFKYQDSQLNFKNKNLELTDNINKIKKNNNKIEKNNDKKEISIDDPIYKGIYKKTNLPCQQDIIYDFNKILNQPSDKFNNDINIKDKITQEKIHNKSIKEVFDSLIIDYKEHSNPNQPVLEVNNINLSNNINYEPYNDDPLLSTVSLF